MTPWKTALAVLLISTLSPAAWAETPAPFLTEQQLTALEAMSMEKRVEFFTRRRAEKARWTPEQHGSHAEKYRAWLSSLTAEQQARMAQKAQKLRQERATALMAQEQERRRAEEEKYRAANDAKRAAFRKKMDEERAARQKK